MSCTAAMRLADLRPLLLTLLWLSTLPTFVTAHTGKFSHWFPLLSAETYENTSSVVCNETLVYYRASLQTGDSHQQDSTCAHHQACILGHLKEDIKSRMASASVLLGVSPGLLASIAPSVSEISLLSVHNPILSLLISLACPAVFNSRILQYDDARQALRGPLLQPRIDLPASGRRRLFALMVVKHLCLSAAIVNVFYTSWQLGTMTVVSFRCASSSLPLAWTALSLVIHIVAAAAFFTQTHHFGFGRLKKARDSSAEAIDTDQPNRPEDCRSNVILERRIRPTTKAILLNYLATFLAFIHVTFGIVIFSSLLFIEYIDIVSVILRYMASTVVARIILVYELQHIRELAYPVVTSRLDQGTVDINQPKDINNITRLAEPMTSQTSTPGI